MSNNSTFGKPFSGGGNKMSQDDVEKSAKTSFNAYDDSLEKAKRDGFKKVNDLNKDIKFDHSANVMGRSLGMSDKECGEMAAKFQLATEKAKAEGRQGNGLLSRTVELVLPTLTPVELAFCAGILIKEQMTFSRKLRSGDIGGLLDLLR